VSATLDTEGRAEEEYLCFLETYGMVDFSLLTFLPPLHTVFRYKEMQEENRLN
jgi:hypothetical protein